MTDFPVHDKATAPATARPLLDASEAAFGRIPNLHGVMAEAPGLLEGYQTLHRLFMATSLNATEQTVVWQTINVEHECHYCVPAHTAIAKAMRVDDAVIDALRNETPLATARLEALRRFTLAMVRQRGNVAQAEIDAFLAAGFTRRQILEVVLGIAQKVMSNDTNHLAQTPLDAATRPYHWQRSRPAA